MLRQPIRGVRMPLRAFDQPTQQAAWNGAWRRLFTSGAREKLPAQLWRRRITPFESLMTGLRSGPTLSTSPGAVRGVLRRGFRFSARRKGTTKASTGSTGAAGKEAGKEATQDPLSLSARLKKLSKEYGWAAVGVYAALSVLDFPFCFLLVRIVGAEKIAILEDYVVSAVKMIIPESVQDRWHEYWRSIKQTETEALGDDEISDKVEMVGWGVEEASQRNKEEPSLATQLALAYAIHKSFIFIRVPLTAAVTPKIVKVLRSWGWNIGKKRGA
ncbi:Fc.00g100550.m01.CDS01 [Cosmosporella sp. VM-42]